VTAEAENGLGHVEAAADLGDMASPRDPAPDGVVDTGTSTAIPVEYPRRSDITRRAWHDSYVPVVFLIAVIVVLAGVFFAATGRGGELAYERVDHAPLDLGPVSAPDIAMLRPPTAMWGYNMQVTDEALDRIARAMRDRDVTIAYLQQQLENRASADPGAPQARPTDELPAASRARQVAELSAASEAFRAAEPPASEALVTAGNPDAPQSPRAVKPPGVLVAPLPPKATQPSATVPSPEASRPAQSAQPSQTLPGSHEALGPQGAYDTYGWWAQQEEAARDEEARRQAAAQEAGQALPNQADPPKASAPEAGAPGASAPEVSVPGAGVPGAGAPEADAPGAGAPEASAPGAGAPEASAPGAGAPEASLPGAGEPEASLPGASVPEADPPEPGSPSARTDTVPNPVITPPDGTPTFSDHSNQPTASSVPPVPPVPPDDDPVAGAEEQAW
jgi:hypothetical protein